MPESTEPVTDALRAQSLAYLKGELTEDEKSFFETMLADSEDLRRELSQSRALLDALHSADDGPVRDRVDAIIKYALQSNATDIHLEPQRMGTRLRYRIDGALHDGETIPRDLHPSLVNRWKVMAEMDVAERRLPQTGRILLRHNGADYELRVSLLPSLYGEKVVARVVARSGVLIGLDRLNLSSAHVATLKRLATLPSGLIIATGNGGTGKTTLLYSVLQQIQQDPEPRVIATVEDPIEYVLGDGAVQTAVNRTIGLTYPAALRAVLRADPDVVYCAETRDLATAELQIEAAVTGNLVLGVLHTSSAVQAIQRLRDIGIENFLIADTLAAVIAPRLVRRIDPHQTEEYQPAPEALERLGLTPADGPFRRGVPSEANYGTGFSGRVPLLEVLEISEPLRRQIADGAPVSELARTAWADGGSLLDDARAKVRQGITTIEEANRVLVGYPIP